MASKMLLHWIDLGIKAKVSFYHEHAPLLTKAIIDTLPLKTISWHSVISGDNIGFALPVIATKAENPQPRERGEVFLYANGQLGIIPYGKTTEPGLVNVWGKIDAQDIDEVERAGRIVAEQFRVGPGRPFYIQMSLEG